MNEDTYTYYGRTWSVSEVAAEYKVPGYIVGALFRYLNHRISPGSFLTNVLSNDLLGAFSVGDTESTAGLGGLVKFIYCHVPAEAHGDATKVKGWLKGVDNANP